MAWQYRKNTLLKCLNAETTQVVIVSKTFITQETLLNAKTAFTRLDQQLGITANCDNTQEYGAYRRSKLSNLATGALGKKIAKQLAQENNNSAWDASTEKLLRHLQQLK